MTIYVPFPPRKTKKVTSVLVEIKGDDFNNSMSMESLTSSDILQLINFIMQFRKS